LCRIRNPVKKRSENGDLITLSFRIHHRERDVVVGGHRAQAMTNLLVFLQDPHTVPGCGG
jgi:hypothetical protein